MRKRIEMLDIMYALEKVSGAPILTSNQCADLAAVLNSKFYVATGVLPCDVKVAPATTIRKGCRIETLMECIRLREGRPEYDCRFHTNDVDSVVHPHNDGLDEYRGAP